MSQDPQFLEAKRLLKKARRILFLGLGYHRRNLERLLAGTELSVDCFGSCFGSTAFEAASIRGTFQSLFKLRIHMGSGEHKVREFLRNHVRLA
jgi:hypothetical protein